VNASEDHDLATGGARVSDGTVAPGFIDVPRRFRPMPPAGDPAPWSGVAVAEDGVHTGVRRGGARRRART